MILSTRTPPPPGPLCGCTCPRAGLADRPAVRGARELAPLRPVASGR